MRQLPTTGRMPSWNGVSLTSRKLLRALRGMDAFPGNRYNKYDGFNDYQFLLDMYNKKYKDDVNYRQTTASAAASARP